MHQDEYIEQDIDIDKLVDDLIEIFRDMPPRYLPLADGIACPYCRGIIHDEVSRPEKDVEEMKCCSCSATFYFDYRLYGSIK